MMHLLLLSVAVVGAAAQQQRGPGQVKLHGLAEEASFLAKHHPRVLQPVLGWHDASTNGRRRLHDLGVLLWTPRFASDSNRAHHHDRPASPCVRGVPTCPRRGFTATHHLRSVCLSDFVLVTHIVGRCRATQAACVLLSVAKS